MKKIIDISDIMKNLSASQGKEGGMVVGELPAEIANIKDSDKKALAIIKEESSMRTDAQSWNCHYDKEGNVHAKAIKGVTKSTFCKAGHEKYAWSVDCGITQQNIVGAKSCPAYTFDMDWSIQKMAVKYEERGNWTAWSAYTSGRYKRWLE